MTLKNKEGSREGETESWRHPRCLWALLSLRPWSLSHETVNFVCVLPGRLKSSVLSSQPGKSSLTGP